MEKKGTETTETTETTTSTTEDTSTTENTDHSSEEDSALADIDKTEEESSEEDSALADIDKTEEESSEEDSSEEKDKKKDKKKDEEPESDDDLEEYDLDFGEETKLQEKDQDKIVSAIESMKLKKGQAKKLLSLVNELTDGRDNMHWESVKSKSAEQKKELLGHINFSSDEKRNESMKYISSAVKQFGSDDLVKVLKGSIGNNVHVANFIRAIGEAMQSDSIQGKGVSTEQTEEESGLASMYPEFYKK